MLEPAAWAATAKALAEAESHHAARLRTFELAVERASYEAQRARRQFDAVEPENRLVARTVEAAWEQRLTEPTPRRSRPCRPASTSSQRAHRRRARLASPRGSRRPPRVRLVRHDPAGTQATAGTILTEVVVTVDSTTRTAGIVIVWQGEASTQLTMTLNKTGGHFRATDEDTVELLGRLSAHYDDRTIADILGRQHRRTGTGLEFTQSRVKSLRVSRGNPAFTPTVAPSDDDAAVFTVKAAGRELGVDHGTIYRWLRTGFLAGEQVTPGAPWQIRINQAVRDRIVPQAPHGWLPLEHAAVALGVSRQTVLHRVQRGDLDAVYLNRGKITRPTDQGDRRTHWTV